MAIIQLTQGYDAIVDDDAPAIVFRYSWSADVKQYSHVYARARINYRLVYLHNLILGMPPKGLEVDHINRDTLDNRSENLRFVTSSQSKLNQGVRSDSTTGVRGVSWHAQDKMYRVQITYKYRKVYDKLFHTLEEATTAAAEAYTALRREIFR